MTPGVGARIIAYEALLELDQDILLPPDNFTLSLNVVDDGHRRSAQTSPGNLTQNESTKAEINASELNPMGPESETSSLNRLVSGLVSRCRA